LWVLWENDLRRRGHHPVPHQTLLASNKGISSQLVWLLSQIFEVGGCSWRVWIFPQRRPRVQRPAHVRLPRPTRIRQCARRVQRARSDRGGNIVPGYTLFPRLTEYAAAGFGHGFGHFIEREARSRGRVLFSPTTDSPSGVRLPSSGGSPRRTEPRVVVPPSNLHRHLGVRIGR
jgi:hypothetical protein